MGHSVPYVLCANAFKSMRMLDVFFFITPHEFRFITAGYVKFSVNATGKSLEINILKPTGYVTHHQFNIQQLYALPHTVFMCFVFI